MSNNIINTSIASYRNTDSHYEWYMKYRPQTLDELIIPEHDKIRLSKMIENNYTIQNLMLVGRPGSGKTTLAHILAQENCSFMINCTTHNSINDMRDLELDRGILFGDKSTFILDEADYLSNDAQAALRGIVEARALNANFIITANEKDKFSDAILSRFRVIDFNFLKDDELLLQVMSRLKDILTRENINIPHDIELMNIIRRFYPDMREILKELQYTYLC
jgi:Straboviridae sliding clamp loader